MRQLWNPPTTKKLLPTKPVTTWFNSNVSWTNADFFQAMQSIYSFLLKLKTAWLNGDDWLVENIMRCASYQKAVFVINIELSSNYSPHSLVCSCVCRSGFEGDRCETNIDDCAGHACQNNATCNDLVDMYSCICPVGYTGNLEDCFKLIICCNTKLSCGNWTLSSHMVLRFQKLGRLRPRSMTSLSWLTLVHTSHYIKIFDYK